MADEQVPAGWVDRYLALLGVARERPSPEALARLVRAQGEWNVFENVTAILRRARTGNGPVPPVDFAALLAARAAGRGGGVCFELAPMFRRLLAALGYRVQPILAQISFPGSHHATIVDLTEVGSERYLVDIGGGAPLWQPFGLGETVEIRHAGLSYRLRPVEPDAYEQDRGIKGEWEVFCRYDLRPAGAAALEAAYQRHQLAGQSWVVGNLTMVRCTPDAVYRLRDDELVTYTARGTQVQHMRSGADYRRAAADVFGVPELPVEAALAALEDMRRTRVG